LSDTRHEVLIDKVGVYYQTGKTIAFISKYLFKWATVAKYVYYPNEQKYAVILYSIMQDGIFGDIL